MKQTGDLTEDCRINRLGEQEEIVRCSEKILKMLFVPSKEVPGRCCSLVRIRHTLYPSSPVCTVFGDHVRG